MKNGYEIIWSEFALIELQKTLEYLEEKWTEKEIRTLAVKIENTLMSISKNPFIF